MPENKPPSFWFMFARPVATLASLGEKPGWFCPVVVSAGISMAANCYVFYRIGLLRLINAAVKSDAILDPEAAVQNALSHPFQIHIIQALSTFLGSVVTTLVIAKVIWLILTLLGRDVRFKKVLALTAYVTALSAIIRACMLALTTTLIRDLNSLDLRNPLATNPAFFFQPVSPTAFRLLSSLDVLTFMNLVLLTIGLTKTCTRLSPRTASMVVVIPWMVYVGTSLLLPPLLS